MALVLHNLRSLSPWNTLLTNLRRTFIAVSTDLAPHCAGTLIDASELHKSITSTFFFRSLRPLPERNIYNCMFLRGIKLRASEYNGPGHFSVFWRKSKTRTEQTSLEYLLDELLMDATWKKFVDEGPARKSWGRFLYLLQKFA